MKLIIGIILITSLNAHACEKNSCLVSSVFKKKRQERVAKMVESCDTIVEIGGAGVAMSGFLSKDKKVIVIDPEIRRKEEENVTHVPKKFQDWNEWPKSTNYAVVILGLKLVMPDGGWIKLYELIQGSAITVIEYDAQSKKARKQFKDIRSSVKRDEWNDPIEIEIAGYELKKIKGKVCNHRILQYTSAAANNMQLSLNQEADDGHESE
ncbi:hypothetical protein BH09DEP1_BH09DEP1_6520 [soil metagenome]